MKTNRWIYVIMIASLCWIACDDDDDLNKPSLNDTDETFVEVAARSNMAEIEFAELASTKATDSLVITFGQSMVSQHTAAQNELKIIADDYDGVDWPNDLSEGHDDILEQLNDLEGDSFDSLYISIQVTMHEDAITAYQTATTNTTDQRVKAYASKYLPHLERHMEMADSIQTVIMTDNTTDEDTN